MLSISPGIKMAENQSLYHLVEWPASDGKKSISVVPQSWLVSGTTTCYWPPNGTTEMIRCNRKPAPFWKQCNYTKILKHSSSWKKIKEYEEAYTYNTEVETENTDIEGSLSRKRKRIPTMKWSPSRDESEVDFVEDSSSSSTLSRSPSPPPKQLRTEPQTQTPFKNKGRQVAVACQQTFSPPPLRTKEQVNQNFSASPSGTSKSTTVDNRSFFEAVLTAVEKVNGMVHQLSCEVHQIRKQLNRMEVSLKVNKEGEEVYRPELPDGFEFPLYLQEDLERLNDLLSQERGIKESMIRASGNFGGSTSKRAIEEAGKKLLRPELSVKYNLLGRKGKRSFNLMSHVKGAMLAGVRSKHPDLDDKSFDKLLGHWLSGSGDRLPGGRKKRLDDRFQTEEEERQREEQESSEKEN